MLHSQSAVITKLLEEAKMMQTANVEIALPEYAKPEMEQLHLKLEAVQKEFDEQMQKLGMHFITRSLIFALFSHLSSIYLFTQEAMLLQKSSIFSRNFLSAIVIVS